jgi:hypothetical protein
MNRLKELILEYEDGGEEDDEDNNTDNHDFKLSLCSVLTVSTFGCFPSVWFILADVSEPSVRSIFKPLKMDLTEGSKTSVNINQTLGKHPKVDTVNDNHARI